MSRPRLLLHNGLLPERAVVDSLTESPAKPSPDESSNASGSQQVTRMQILEQKLVVKTYVNARRGIERLRPLRLTRAWRSYHAANRLRAAGIATPMPQFLAHWNGDLLLACEQVDAAQLYGLLRRPDWIADNREQLVNELSGMLEKLRLGRITHGDLHPRNILIDCEGKAWLVDLDGTCFHRSPATFARRRSRDETRLAKHLELQPDILAQIGFRRQANEWVMQE